MDISFRFVIIKREMNSKSNAVSMIVSQEAIKSNIGNDRIFEKLSRNFSLLCWIMAYGLLKWDIEWYFD